MLSTESVLRGAYSWMWFINKVLNADINGALNHTKIATGKSFEWLKDKLFTL